MVTFPLLAAAVDALPHAVCIVDASGLRHGNPAALALFGVATLQDLPQDPAAFVRKFRLRDERDGVPVEPATLPRAGALRGQTATRGSWITRPDGAELHLREFAAPLPGPAAVVVFEAFDPGMPAQQAIGSDGSSATAVHEQELRALVKGVRDYAIYTIDPQGRISSWHAGAQLMKGYSAAEAIGMPFENLFTEQDRAAGRPAQELREAAQTGEFKGEGLRRRKNGEIFEAAVVLTALRGPQGELLGFLKLTQDISQRRQMERERAEGLHAAEVARADAERISYAMGEFLATISHELRTPLGAILGWAQVLQREPSDSAAVAQGLAAITRNARIQAGLIDDLLDMNRIEAGRLRLDLQSVDLAAVIASAVEAVLPASRARGIRLQTLLDTAAPKIHGDAARLQQVVWNLLSNAVKFTPRGGHVRVALSQRRDEVEISVSDTGQGMDALFLPRLFERFQQQDASTTRRHGGLGLGLAIVRQLVQLHGGTVRADSPGPGRGSTFTVCLPAPAVDVAPADERSSAPPVRPTAAPPPEEPRLDGIRLLLVDDEPDGREMAAHMLRAAGASVLTASSAVEGFALLREHRPDALLSDIGMPEHDGYDLMAWVRALDDAEGGTTPAIAFTAYARSEDERRALAAGYQARLVKPVEPQALVAAVASVRRRPVGLPPNAPAGATPEHA